MSDNMKWKSKEDIEKEKLTEEETKSKKEKYKGKNFANLSRAEKDELLEMLAQEIGLL